MTPLFLLSALSALTACFFLSPISVSLTTITYLAAFLFSLGVGNWQERWQRIVGNKAALSFWLLGILFIIGTVYTTASTHLVMHDLQKRHWIFITPFLISLLWTPIWRRRMQNAFLCAAILILVLSYLEMIFHFTLHQFFVHLRTHTVGDVFSDHIIQSMAMNIAAFIFAYRLLFEKKWRLAYAALFLLAAVNIVFISQGRTGYGIFFLLLIYVGLIRYGWKGVSAAISACLILVMGAYVGSANFHFRMKNAYEHLRYHNQIHKDTAITKRLEMYQIAEKMIRERPWFGYGTGGIENAVSKVVPEKDRQYNKKVDFVESIYLNFLLEFGIVGFLVLLIAIALQVKTTFELPTEYRYLMQFVLIAVLTGGMINSFFVSFAVAHFYALFSALCFGAKSSHQDE